MAQLCARIVVDRSSSHLKKNNRGAIFYINIWSCSFPIKEWRLGWCLEGIQ